LNSVSRLTLLQCNKAPKHFNTTAFKTPKYWGFYLFSLQWHSKNNNKYDGTRQTSRKEPDSLAAESKHRLAAFGSGKHGRVRAPLSDF
jgi:predicted SPOUT superfamily RNA methylase MTH1